MNKEIKFDVFLNYAGQDLEIATYLANRFRDEGVNVWFDQWEISNKKEVVNNALLSSRKLLVIWTPFYFSDQTAQKFTRQFLNFHSETSKIERFFIPLLFKECEIPEEFKDYTYFNFCVEDDFPLRFHQLIEVLDIEKYKSDEEKTWEERKFYEKALVSSDVDTKQFKTFTEEIAELYTLLNFTVNHDKKVEGIKTSFSISQEISGFAGYYVNAFVICKKIITSKQCTSIVKLKNSLKKEFPDYKWIVVSSFGFEGKTRSKLVKSEISCSTHAELLNSLLPIVNYEQSLIKQCQKWMKEKWMGKDLFIRPYIETDTTYEVEEAYQYFASWLKNANSNFLVILGDLGTGKSTLSQFLFYDLAKSFIDDPLRHPAPVLIPLKEVRKEISLEGIVISHFARHDLSIDFNRFIHLLENGKIILFVDAFDEMADRVEWDVTQSNFNELRRAGIRKGKVILTCRTHYFKDRTEQTKLIVGDISNIISTETELYRDIKHQSGAEITYLKEFDTDQIQKYLKKVKPDGYEQYWEKINNIHNLEELAHRPLLLDMIVNSLPYLQNHEDVNASSLYIIFTNLWIKREKEKGAERVLDNKIKQAIVLQLSWWMWHEEKERIHYNKLITFIRQFEKGRGWTKEDIDIVFREMMRASFLKRDESGNFSFMHRSFMEFFLARRLHITFSLNKEALYKILNTQRFDRKIIFFLTLLDKKEKRMIEPLKAVLNGPYLKGISENALQILYWSARIDCGMEDRITDIEVLTKSTGARIPKKSNLQGADLQGMILEGADLRISNFTGADLTGANLNHALLTNSTFKEANLEKAKLENSIALRVDFSKANIKDACFNGSDLTDSAFIGVYKDASFINVKGIDASKKIDLLKLEPVIQTGYTGGVSTLAISPDGVYIAIASYDGMVIIYRIRNNSIIRMLEGDTYKVNSMKFSPNGRWLAIGGDDRKLKILDVYEGIIIFELEGHEHRITSVDFSPDGKTIATASQDQSIIIWEMGSGNILYKLEDHTDVVTSVAFSPKTTMLASGGKDKKIRLWNPLFGKFIRSMTGSTGSIHTINFSPDGKLLVTGGGDRVLRIWDVSKGDVIKSMIEHSAAINYVEFSQDGSMIVSAGHDKKICVWNSKTGGRLRTNKNHIKSVNFSGFLPESNAIISGSDDGSVSIWDFERKRSSFIIKDHPHALTSLDITHNGSHIVAGSENQTISLWCLNQEKYRFWGIEYESPTIVVQGHTGSVTSVCFSKQGTSIVSGSEDQSIRLWDTKKGKPLHGHLGPITSVSILPDGSKVISGSLDRSVRLWDINTTKNIFSQKGHSDGVTAVECSPDGSLIASASMNSSITIWKVKDKMTMHTLKEHVDTITSLIFSKNGKIMVSASHDKTICFWDIASGTLIKKIEAHEAPINDICFSSDDKLLATGSADKLINIWEVESSDCVRSLKGNFGSVLAVKFAPNGKYLIAAGYSGRLQFWDYIKGNVFLYRYSFGPGAWLDLLPDGRFNASPEGLRYLSYTEQSSLDSFRSEDLVRELYDPKGVKDILKKYVG